MGLEGYVTTVYLSLGSNLGDRLAHFHRALERMAEAGQVVDKSTVWITEPWGYEDDKPYLNMACRYDTVQSLSALHSFLKRLEQEAGRSPRETAPGHYTARELDIDILFFGDQVVETDTLVVPHPRLHLRNFVLQPLAEIAPQYIHPLLGLTVEDLLKRSPDPTEPLVPYDGL